MLYASTLAAYNMLFFILVVVYPDDSFMANVAEYVFGDDMINRWEPYAECPNLMPGCTAFRLNNVPGKEGIVDLTTLTGNNEYLYVTFGDEKGTGFAKARMEYFSGPKTNFAVAILGQHEGKEVMFTFHPGDPIRPSTVPDEKSLWGKQFYVKDAIKMGVRYAKLI